MRGGTHLGGWGWNDIARSARSTIGRDPTGERAEFATLVEAAHALVDGGKATPDVAGID